MCGREKDRMRERKGLRAKRYAMSVATYHIGTTYHARPTITTDSNLSSLLLAKCPCVATGNKRNELQRHMVGKEESWRGNKSNQQLLHHLTRLNISPRLTRILPTTTTKKDQWSEEKLKENKLLSCNQCVYELECN